MDYTVFVTENNLHSIIKRKKLGKLAADLLKSGYLTVFEKKMLTDIKEDMELYNFVIQDHLDCGIDEYCILSTTKSFIKFKR